MELRQAQSLAEEFLGITHPLVEGRFKAKSNFAHVVWGALRRDYLTLYTMLHLSKAGGEEKDLFGNSCMDLGRRVLEDLVSLEYMKMKGKEKMSKKFKDFKTVEAKRDLDFLKSAGVEMDKKLIEQTEKDYEGVRKKLKTRRVWAGLDVESMIIQLQKNGIITPKEVGILTQTYIQGNRKNHFSPSDIFNFLHKSLFDYSNKNDLKSSLLLANWLLIRMAWIFTEEFEVDNKVKQSLDNLWSKILKAHLPQAQQT